MTLDRVANLADRFIVSVLGSFYFDMQIDQIRSTPDNRDSFWDDVLDRADWHGVSPLIYYAVTNSSRFSLPESVLEELKERFFATFVQQAFYQVESERLLRLLAEKGIDVIVLKGLVLSRLIYPDPALRSFSDIDLLFKEKDWGAIRAIFIDEGFTPKRDYAALPARLIPEEVFEHNIAFYNQAGVALEFKLDPFDLGIGSKIIDEVWEKSVVYDFGASKYRSLSPEHQLIQLLVHLNRHGFQKLRWFVDIALILKDKHLLDWELIADCSKREQIQAPVYFSLKHICRLFDIRLGEDKIGLLRPNYIKRCIWRLNWPGKSIYSFNGIRDGALVFPRRLLSGWLIPNMVLTGKTATKINYFMRKVFPPRDFLERKYGDGGDGAKKSYAHYMVKRYSSPGAKANAAGKNTVKQQGSKSSAEPEINSKSHG